MPQGLCDACRYVSVCYLCRLQLLDVDPNDQEEDGANIDLDSQRKGKCAVIKTSTRQVPDVSQFFSVVFLRCFFFLRFECVLVFSVILRNPCRLISCL